MKQAMINYTQNEKNDELYTPAYAVAPLIKNLIRFVSMQKIWCPCDKEESNIVKELKAAGFDVVHSHIDEGKDFFSYEPDKYDMIITNPPYSIKDKIIERCYQLGKPFALLLPLTALEGINRGKMYREGGVGLIVLDKRVEFLEGKTNWFNTSWFCRLNGISGTIIFETIEKDKQ